MVNDVSFPSAFWIWGHTFASQSLAHTEAEQNALPDRCGPLAQLALAPLVAVVTNSALLSQHVCNKRHGTDSLQQEHAAQSTVPTDSMALRFSASLSPAFCDCARASAAFCTCPIPTSHTRQAAARDTLQP